MSIPTVAVTCIAYDQNGTPIAGGRVTAKLNQTEIYNGFVVPEQVSGVADANGVCVLDLWPNALGVSGSSYSVTAVNPDNGKTYLRTTAVVPNSACNLHEIIVVEPYPEIDAAEQALIAAQAALAPVTAQAAAAATSATNAASSASAAANSASSASDSATTATSQAGTATTQAGIATTQAGTATTQAGIATTQADTATTQAGIATTQAGIATTKASEAASSASTAATSAGTATTQAGIATTKASEAAASATNASNSAYAVALDATAATTAKDQAVSSASAAASSATAAAGSATAASTSATSASNSASTADMQAGIATTQADLAITAANTATTKANEASASASDAASSVATVTTQAGIATTQAGIATTQATAAAASAVQADASVDAIQGYSDAAVASAAAAAASQTAAANSATSAQTSATTATTQAGIATTKASEAAASADSVSAAAATATAQANIATAQASAASASASAASASSSAADTDATIAANAATSATASANNATGQANSAANSAASALSIYGSTAAQQAAVNSAQNSATTATTQASLAATARTGAETARDAAVVAQNNAVAVVTGGTATLTAQAGKIPLADAQAKISPAWLTNSALVEQTDIGTAPNEIPLNQYLGNLAYQDAANIAGPVGVGGALTLNSGTINGVTYLNGSKVLTTGSALTFDGSSLGVLSAGLNVGDGTTTLRLVASGGVGLFGTATDHPLAFRLNNTEQMRLTSTGLGIGTSSPAVKLHVAPVSYPFGTAFVETIRIQNNATGGTPAVPTSLGALTWASGVTTHASINGIFENATASNRASLAFSTNNGTSSVERMRLDSSGNLGLGVTPSAWGFNGNLELPATNNISFQGSGNLLFNAFYSVSSSGYLYKISAAAARYQATSGGQHQWYTAPSGTAGNAISFTQAMTLTASSELNIDSGTGGGRLTFTPGVASNIINSTTAGFATWNTVKTRASDHQWLIGGSLQAMTLNASGSLLVGTTSLPTDDNTFLGFGVTSAGEVRASVNNAKAAMFKRATSDGTVVEFRKDSSLSGTISVTASTTTYNTSSDYRLKDITGPVTNSGAYIDSLNPVEGTWKADGSTFVGLIAHEVQEASRTQVATGTKDGEEMQAMDYSNAELIANLIAEVKSLRARVAQLEAA
jgi:hypothetical protein